MGRFADVYDHAEDKYWTFHYQGREWPSTPPRPIRHDCGFCTRSFETDQVLQTHVFAEHKREGFFLRINDRVVAADEPVIEGFIKSLDVIPVGTDAFKCSITLPNETAEFPFESEHGTAVSITRHLDLADVEGVVEIVGHVKDVQSVRRIHVQAVPEAELESIDERVLECQEPLFDNREPHWRQLNDLRELTRTERVYAEGFASYLLACHLEACGDWPAAKRAKEIAFHSLRAFRTRLASDVIGILAFRMHAFSILASRSRSSLFQPAVKFFTGTTDAPSPLSSGSRPPTSGIWIDDFQEGLLASVDAVYAGDDVLAISRAESLPANLANEPGNRRKRNVVLARLYKRTSQTARATGYFRELLDDALYASEAKESLRNVH